MMATYALPALTTSLFRLKYASPSSNASAFQDRDVSPRWLPPLVRSFLNLLQLPPNWNGYGAVQIQKQIVQKALIVLVDVLDDDAPIPSVVPLTDGGVQVEWHRGGRNLEIEFSTEGAPEFYYYEDDSDLEAEGSVSKNYTRIRTYITSLK
jgi:hypothetical protein